MKRNQHIILLLCILISVSAKSQFNKGDRLIGGGVNAFLNTSNYTSALQPTNNSNGSGTTLVPRYSWVNKNNVMNGIFLSGSYGQTKSNYSNQTII